VGYEIVSEHLNGVCLIKPDVYYDDRGFFMESYRYDNFSRLGISDVFVQDNHSRSKQGVIRGMHFQWDKPQGKLIRVTSGKAYVVEVDIRHGSPTLGKWVGFELSEENKYLLWVPPGFANGFCSLSQWVDMQYKCTAVWNPKGEAGISWNDPEIAIEWQIENPLISEKDKNLISLKNWLMSENSKSLFY
jgi:dTDP-4-dehydrorhamnose 3,5-epimerase